MKIAKIFAKIDASKAFWQVGLTERSSQLTTYQTPFGPYRFLRMLYEMKTASEIFHRLYTEIFNDIKNLAVYIDGILDEAGNKTELKDNLN